MSSVLRIGRITQQVSDKQKHFVPYDQKHGEHPALLYQHWRYHKPGSTPGVLKIRLPMRINTMEEIKMRTIGQNMAHAVNPYGDDHAGEHIADVLEGKEYTP